MFSDVSQRRTHTALIAARDYSLNKTSLTVHIHCFGRRRDNQWTSRVQLAAFGN